MTKADRIIITAIYYTITGDNNQGIRNPRNIYIEFNG